MSIIAKEKRELLVDWNVDANLNLLRLSLDLKADLHREVNDKLRVTGDKLIIEDDTSHPLGDALYKGLAQISGQLDYPLVRKA